METRTPPPLPPPKSFRRAVSLNFFLPGAGQYYLGQRGFGAALAGVFLACLLASVAIFLIGYVRYLNVTLSGNILEGDNLERLGDVFHSRWLLGLLAVGLAVFITAMVALAAQRPARASPAPGIRPENS